MKYIIEGRWFPSLSNNTMYENTFLMVYDTLTIVPTKMGVIQSIGVQWILVLHFLLKSLHSLWKYYFN